MESALEEAGGLGKRQLLLIVDQFEELFRFGLAGLGQRQTGVAEARARNEATLFVQILLDARRVSNVHILITMRSDFIGDCAYFSGLPEAGDASASPRSWRRRTSSSTASGPARLPGLGFDGPARAPFDDAPPPHVVAEIIAWLQRGAQGHPALHPHLPLPGLQLAHVVLMLGDFWRQRSAGRKGTSLSGLEGFALHLAQTPQDRRIEIPECRGLDAIGEHAREEPSWKMGGSESVQDYEAMRRRIGLYNFSSQYQQRPIPISGNLVKREWLRFYDPKGDIPRFLRIVQSWDTASKTSELNDYSVCTTWGCAGETFYLMDVFAQASQLPGPWAHIGGVRWGVLALLLLLAADAALVSSASAARYPTSWRPSGRRRE